MAEAKSGGGEIQPQANSAAATRQKTLNMLEEKIDKKEKQISKIEATVFQVANYYFVFQGVILTTVINGSFSSSSSSSSTSSFCKYFWLPLSLCVTGAFLNISTLYINAKKYKDCLDELDKRNLTWYRYFKQDQSATLDRNQAWRKTVMWISMALLLVFSILNIVATVMIPCHY